MVGVMVAKKDISTAGLKDETRVDVKAERLDAKKAVVTVSKTVGLKVELKDAREVVCWVARLVLVRAASLD